MFSKELSRRDVPEGSVSPDVVIVQQPALNNPNPTKEIALVPEPETVLGLEMEQNGAPSETLISTLPTPNSLIA